MQELHNVHHIRHLTARFLDRPFDLLQDVFSLGIHVPLPDHFAVFVYCGRPATSIKFPTRTARE